MYKNDKNIKRVMLLFSHNVDKMFQLIQEQKVDNEIEI